VKKCLKKGIVTICGNCMQVVFFYVEISTMCVSNLLLRYAFYVCL